jgi:hypothetical protein
LAFLFKRTLLQDQTATALIIHCESVAKNYCLKSFSLIVIHRGQS